MIAQYEAGNLLRQEISQLSGKVYPSRISLEVYALMNYFSDYTKHAVEEHNFNTAKKCFALAERLFRQGDKIVRMLIENIFVFAFTSMLPVDREERSLVRSMIPVDLYSLYIKQVTQSGC